MYDYTIVTPDKTINFSTELPYVEAVLFYIDKIGLGPDCTITHNNITINPTSKDYNLKHYRKNYLKIMNNQARYKSTKLFHIDNLK